MLIVVSAKYKYEPDYAVSPGSLLQERLDLLGMSVSDLAVQIGSPAEYLRELVAGEAALHREVAVALERQFGLAADIWLGIDSKYHDRRTIEWATKFPIKDLIKRGAIEKPTADTDLVTKLLDFFGASSFETWQEQHRRALVAYRHSPSFKSDEFALAAWLRLGLLAAERQHCEEYDERTFREELSDIRALTRHPSSETLQTVQSKCNSAGVALIFVQPFRNMAVSGISRWLSPRKALIQLSLRYGSDDHAWFTFFHESGHILVDQRAYVFLHGTNREEADFEAAANEWAADFLIPRQQWHQFADSGNFTSHRIARFAEEQGIVPGIVVGRLQHEKLIGWNSRLNSLKGKFNWSQN